MREIFAANVYWRCLTIVHVIFPTSADETRDISQQISGTFRPPASVILDFCEIALVTSSWAVGQKPNLTSDSKVINKSPNKSNYFFLSYKSQIRTHLFLKGNLRLKIARPFHCKRFQSQPSVKKK